MEKINEVLELIKERGFDVEYKESLKNNMKKKGIMFRTPESNISPIIYIPDEISDVEKTAYDMIMQYKEACKNMPMFNNINLKNFTLDDIQPCVCNTKKNKELLEKAVHKDLPIGLSIYYRIWIDNNSSLIILRDHLPALSVTEEEIYKATSSYTKKNLFEFVAEKMGFPLMKPESGPEVYIITNDNYQFGASALSDEVTLEEIRAMFNNKPYYILPSSVHEILVLNADEQEETRNMLFEMVREVNSTEVLEQDFLSDDVFIYDGTLKIA